MATSSEYQAKIHKQRRRAGLCIGCGKRSPTPGRIRCAGCLKKAVEHQRGLRASRRAAGKCYSCGEAVPVLCAGCSRRKQERRSDRSPTRARVEALSAVGTITRTRQLGHVLASVILLRTGRWTITEWSAELGVQRRTTYRLITTLRRAGIAVEVSREREHERGPTTPLYSIPGEPIRKLLRL